MISSSCSTSDTCVTNVEKTVIRQERGLVGLWFLTPLLTIFQLYRHERGNKVEIVTITHGAHPGRGHQ